MRCTWSHRTSMSSGFSITGTQGGGAHHPLLHCRFKQPNGCYKCGVHGHTVRQCLSYSMPSSLASNNPIFLRAQINQTHRNVVLDTGSGTTIINHKFLKQIQHELFRSISTFYSSANCTKINIIGEILLEIKINNICTHVTAAVAQDLVTDLLLGTDWINRYVRSIDITNKTITIHDNMGYTSTTPIIQPPDSSCLSVSLLNPITFPPAPQYFHNLHGYLSDLTDVTRRNITGTQQRYKSRFNANRSNPVYQINDLVLVKTIRSRHKFDIRHEGPFRIIQRIGDKTYVVQHTHISDYTRQVTVDFLIPLIERKSTT